MFLKKNLSYKKLEVNELISMKYEQNRNSVYMDQKFGALCIVIIMFGNGISDPSINLGQGGLCFSLG